MYQIHQGFKINHFSDYKLAMQRETRSYISLFTYTSPQVSHYIKAGSLQVYSGSRHSTDSKDFLSFYVITIAFSIRKKRTRVANKLFPLKCKDGSKRQLFFNRRSLWSSKESDWDEVPEPLVTRLIAATVLAVLLSNSFCWTNHAFRV